MGLHVPGADETVYPGDSSTLDEHDDRDDRPHQRLRPPPADEIERMRRRQRADEHERDLYASQPSSSSRRARAGNLRDEPTVDFPGDVRPHVYPPRRHPSLNELRRPPPFDGHPSSFEHAGHLHRDPYAVDDLRDALPYYDDPRLRVPDPRRRPDPRDYPDDPYLTYPPPQPSARRPAAERPRAMWTEEDELDVLYEQARWAGRAGDPGLRRWGADEWDLCYQRDGVVDGYGRGPPEHQLYADDPRYDRARPYPPQPYGDEYAFSSGRGRGGLSYEGPPYDPRMDGQLYYDRRHGSY